MKDWFIIFFPLELKKNPVEVMTTSLNSLILKFFFWPCYMAYRILVSQPGLNFVPPALKCSVSYTEH